MYSEDNVYCKIDNWTSCLNSKLMHCHRLIFKCGYFSNGIWDEVNVLELYKYELYGSHDSVKVQGYIGSDSLY